MLIGCNSETLCCSQAFNASTRKPAKIGVSHFINAGKLFSHVEEKQQKLTGPCRNTGPTLFRQTWDFTRYGGNLCLPGIYANKNCSVHPGDPVKNTHPPYAK